MKSKYFIKSFLVLGNLALCVMVSCSKTGGDSTPTPTPVTPTSTTTATTTAPTVSNLTTDVYTGTIAPYVAAHDSIVSGGDIYTDGGATVTARGVCWSTSQTPTIADKKTSDGTGIGIFTSHINGLTVNTTYYLRAYATNSAGTGYSPQISLVTAYKLGETFGGGVIIYIDPTTLHGLIATHLGLTETIWGTGSAGATSTSNGDGNTTLIIKAFGASAQNAATSAKSCRDGGFSDWFLPSINQLTILGNPPNGDTYWSSTETTTNSATAYVTTQPYGNPFAEIKSIKHEVRPMRAF